MANKKGFRYFSSFLVSSIRMSATSSDLLSLKSDDLFAFKIFVKVPQIANVQIS